MPTGYTAKLYEGKEQSALEYILSICNQFSPFHTTSKDLKEMSLDEIRKLVSYDDTYDKWLQREIEEKEKLSNTTDDNIQTIIDESFNKRLQEHRESEFRKIEIRKRYENMLVEIQNWKCGESCNNIKKFAIQQLLDSIDFDCKSYEYKDLHNKQTVEEYKKTMNDIHDRNIERYEEQIEECKTSYERNLKFIEDFIMSIELLK